MNPLVPATSYNELKKRFPNASDYFLRKNSYPLSHPAGGVPKDTQPEPAVRDEPLGKAKGKEANSERFRVSVTSYRTRLIDPDNLTPKYFIDACRYAGLIPSDDPKTIDLLVKQVLCKSNPRTEIVIEKI